MPAPVRARRLEARLLFILPLALYLVGGWFLAFRWQSIFGDAQSRLANGYYILYSRDPHVAAIGFVWMPLMSLSVLPLLLLKGIWPALGQHAFAANIMSAVFMATAVHNLRRILLAARTPTAPRIALVILFALNPMVWFYGANGMSEALFLCCLLYSVRYLARWLAEPVVQDLARAGIALALAYLTRNEAALGAVVATIAVVGATALRAAQPMRRKIMTAITDACIFALPFAAASLGWALISWIIVGDPIQQLHVLEGAGQVEGGTGIDTGNLVRQAYPHVLHSVFGLAPLLPLLAAAAVVILVRRKDFRPLAPLALLGGTLLFTTATALARINGGFLRYYIVAIPLSFCLAACLAASPAPLPDGTMRAGGGRVARRLRSLGLRRGGHGQHVRHWTVTGPTALGCVVAVVLAAPGVATAAVTIHDPHFGQEEFAQLRSLFIEGNHDSRDGFGAENAMAHYLDGLHLATGSILVDNVNGCVPALILLSRHPAQFVIPNDQDFARALADPVTHRVGYMLAVPPQGLGALDAVNRTYPSMYEDGSGLGVRVDGFHFAYGGCPAFRLFKLFGAPAGPTNR